MLSNGRKNAIWFAHAACVQTVHMQGMANALIFKCSAPKTGRGLLSAEFMPANRLDFATLHSPPLGYQHPRQLVFLRFVLAPSQEIQIDSGWAGRREEGRQ